MPLKTTKFSLDFNDLTDAIDVDDSAGRSVPINLNFVEEGSLAKDTGYVIVGAPETALAHSEFYYKKKNGTSYTIRALGTALQSYSAIDRVWYALPGSPAFTAGAEFGYAVYNDVLHLGNAVESLYTFDGTTFTPFAGAPKGNNLEIFEDRLHISGVIAEPLSLYYSDVGVPTTFQVASVVKPLGTDYIVTQKNFYGNLLIFKTSSIWKLTYEYNQVVSNYVPQLVSQSANYGACSRKAVTPVENDLWFFTGKETRSIGFQDNQVGVLGVNQGVISNPIKTSLALLSPLYYSKVVTFYYNRRYYLSVAQNSAAIDTVYVCHLLYKQSWTKYTGRDKARINDFMVIDGVIYTTFVGTSNGTIKWTVDATDALPSSYYLITEQ